jgi:ligand-binding sensor protein
MLHVAKSSDEPYGDLCEIGLLNVAVPIFSDGDFNGGLVACGTGLSDEPLDHFLVAKSLDIEATEAGKLIAQVPIVEAAQADRIAERFVQLLGENHPRNDD